MASISSSLESADQGPGPLPRVFGRYVLFDRIGRGGMADIFLARADTAFGGSRLCVLKQILPQLSHDVGFERLLVSEAKLAAQLTHANVVQVFDLGREGDRLFIAMEYVEGFDLNQLLRALSEGRIGLPAEFALLVVSEVLRGLDYAHRAKDVRGRPLGLVHRDVSPSNVLVSFEGEVKLCDFGIARALTAHDERLHELQDQAPRVIGKSAYMSPEQARGESIDARSDVFSVGILLWELCAGRRLYRGTESEMLAQARRGEIPALPDRGLPRTEHLAGLVEHALHPERERRFQSAQEFLRSLEDYVVAARLMVSQLRFATFLTDHFSERILELRRERERAARALPSELPPTLDAQAEPASEETPTVVADSSLLLASAFERGEVLAGWSEPGAEPTDGGAASPHSAGSPLPADAGTERVEAELDSLAARAEAAAESRPPASAPITKTASLPVPPTAARREWLWYVAALAILALGVLGYLWR